MQVDTLLNSQESSSNSEQSEQLDSIKRKLLDYRQDLHAYPLLRAVVTWWLLRAQDVPASSAAEAVEKRLHDVRAGNQMYNGPEEFPDTCKRGPNGSECPHYGTACPVITDLSQQRRLEEILSIDNPDDLRRSLRTFARDNECHVLLDVLDSVSREYGPLLTDGLIITILCQERLLFEEDMAEQMLSAIDSLPEKAQTRLRKATNGNLKALVRGDDLTADPGEFGLDEAHPATDIGLTGATLGEVEEAVQEDLEVTGGSD